MVLLFACLALRSCLIARWRSSVSYLLADCISILGSPPCYLSRPWRCLLLRVRGNTVGERNALSARVFVEEENAAGLWFPLGNSATDCPRCLAGSTHWRNREGRPSGDHPVPFVNVSAKSGQHRENDATPGFLGSREIATRCDIIAHLPAKVTLRRVSTTDRERSLVRIEVTRVHDSVHTCYFNS